MTSQAHLESFSNSYQSSAAITLKNFSGWRGAILRLKAYDPIRNARRKNP